MLKQKDYTGKTKSVYICDRCNTVINTAYDKCYKIVVNTYKDNTTVFKAIKRYDLCRKCASIFCNYVEKGVKK